MQRVAESCMFLDNTESCLELFRDKNLIRCVAETSRICRLYMADFTSLKYYYCG
jgi:hypothetical protein